MAWKRKVNTGMAEKIIAMQHQGLTYAQIADILGLSEKTIGQYADKDIRQSRGRGVAVTPEVHQKINDLYIRDCLSITEISKKLEIPRSTVGKHIDNPRASGRE